MLKQFVSCISFKTIKVDTIIGSPNIAFGETLSGTVYIDGGDSENLVNFIEIELVKRDTQKEYPITKQSFELVSTVKSKETHMIPFELVPDERWEMDATQETLFLRTIVHIKNANAICDEDIIMYS